MTVRHLYGGITIWVDAICINQGSGTSKEKDDEQIPLMGEIYSRATTVHIWLGPDKRRGNRQPVKGLTLEACLAWNAVVGSW